MKLTKGKTIDSHGMVKGCLFFCRFMTCSCVVDYSTVAAADKFGNIAIVCTYTCTLSWSSCVSPCIDQAAE